MKRYVAFAFLLAPVSALSVSPVSAFDFSGTLDPFVNSNPGNVSPLAHLNGGADPTGVTSSYASALVGTTTKQVLNFASGDTLFATHGIAHNGGGSYVNEYTILMDVRFDNQADGAYTSLFNTNANNSNDGDSFLLWGAGNVATVGIQGDYGGSVSGNAWHRLAVAVQSFSDGTELTYYLDGAQIHQRINRHGGEPIDGRWALYGYDDGDAASDGVFILGDNDGDNGSGQISQLAFYDKKLSLSEVQGLGGVGQPVPEPASLAVLGLGVAAALRRRRR